MSYVINTRVTICAYLTISY